MTTAWEDIEIPQGTFIGWGEVGQTVTGKVVAYSPEGGRDFSGNACPQLVLEVTEDAITFKDKGTTRATIAAGELATLNAGQANLRRNLAAASLNVGDLIRIAYSGNYTTASGTGKEFKVQVARGTKAPDPGEIFGS